MATHKWQVSLLGKSHGQRNLAGYSTEGHKESDRTEQLKLSLSHKSYKGVIFRIPQFSNNKLNKTINIGKNLNHYFIKKIFKGLYTLKMCLLNIICHQKN